MLFPGIFVAQGDAQDLANKPVPPAGDLGSLGQQVLVSLSADGDSCPGRRGPPPAHFSFRNVGNYL